MFKRLASMILAFLLTLSFAGCAQTSPDSTDGSVAGSAAASTTGSTGAKDVQVDENLLTVDITLPASFFEGQDMSAFDADAYAEEQGFVSAKANEDGSVTVTMTKAKYNEILDEMAASLDATFAEFVNAEDTPYIKEITHNDDFSEVTMKVDRAAYENAYDFTAFAISISAAMYQAFLESECHVEVSIVDVATGDTIDTVTYPTEG